MKTEKEMKLIKNQLEQIEKIIFLLDQLEASTYERPEGRKLTTGFCSYYPNESIKLMKTMKYALELEVFEKNEYLENKKNNI